jgi:hypothetical protein
VASSGCASRCDSNADSAASNAPAFQKAIATRGAEDAEDAEDEESAESARGGAGVRAGGLEGGGREVRGTCADARSAACGDARMAMR